MVFHWILSECKSPQVPWTLLSILASLNNAVNWMVSNLPLISKSPSLFSTPLGTVPSASNWYHRYLHVTQLIPFSSKIQVVVVVLLLLHLLYLCLLKNPPCRSGVDYTNCMLFRVVRPHLKKGCVLFIFN